MAALFYNSVNGSPQTLGQAAFFNVNGSPQNQGQAASFHVGGPVGYGSEAGNFNGNGSHLNYNEAQACSTWGGEAMDVGAEHSAVTSMEDIEWDEPHALLAVPTYVGPYRPNPFLTRDQDSGLIEVPRVPPHRSDLKPAKSCLKRGKKNTKKPRGQNQVRTHFRTPHEEVELRCIITGHVYKPHAREPKESLREHRAAVRAMKRRGEILEEAEPDWSSDCDVPMSGISDELDWEAAQYRAEEDELDEWQQLALRNQALNKRESRQAYCHWDFMGRIFLLGTQQTTSSSVFRVSRFPPLNLNLKTKTTSKPQTSNLKPQALHAFKSFNLKTLQVATNSHLALDLPHSAAWNPVCTDPSPLRPLHIPTSEKQRAQLRVVVKLV
ncbi:hypothetical protein B0T25DRAFT_523200 [Lasiosphaeria hispida]|uniref:Uncharacterized protein n=1 Tax=Lasiosphaeria hispida TaxID=260671 RepID=A0AAJ0H845_9PEZI|nr:hypothetical protein B0T25DRAFT_523200 [Lasiosphaeria hispida]